MLEAPTTRGMSGDVTTTTADTPRPQQVPGYRLDRVLGAGGQGEVWQAHDEIAGRDVAVKFLGRGATPAATLALEAEIQATAQLRHRHVVSLLDHGRTLGSEPLPFVVMELGQGTLDGCVAGSFEELHLWLRAILLGLGHAHARGVVHCDVKPPNVLWVDGVLKLSDFGIARVRRLDGDPGPTRPAAWATWAYGAPELQSGEPELVGPWTDLYAVGITAFELATGEPPFHGAPADVLRAHRRATLPPLETAFPRPAGLEDWLRSLVEKSPTARVQRAFDALEALDALRAPAARAAPRFLPPRAMTSGERTLPTDLVEVPAPSIGPGHLLAPAPAHSLPASWIDRDETSPEHAVREPVLATRATPVVGRDRERDLLWARLREVVSEGAGRLCLVRGPSGVGKSHLAAWLAQRAHEVGVANVLSARHAGPGAPHDGLRGMWLRYLGCGPDAGARLHLVVERALGGGTVDPVDRWALATSLRPGGHEEHGEQELVALTVRLLRACATRPLVLFVDDLTKGTDGLALLRALVGSPSWATTPVLVVATVQDDAPDPVPGAEAALAELTPHATVLSLDALDEPSLHTLLTGPLGLAATAARRVAERFGGSPLFAVQQVADWAQRGILRRTGEGFDVADVEADMPSGLARVWRDRVGSTLGEHGVEARASLELAAVLGLEIDAREHALACTLAALPSAEPVLGELVRHRLLVAGPSGWRFVHAMLRASLLTTAAEAGRLPRLHAAAADAIGRCYPEAAPGVAERRARHLDAAGRTDEALEATLLALEVAGRQQDHVRLELLLADHARLLVRSGAADGEHRERAIVAHAWSHVQSGRYAEAAALAAELDDVTDPPLSLACLRGRLAWTMQRGPAAPPIETALVEARARKDAAGEARCLLELAHARQFQGAPRAAAATYEEAAAAFAALGDRWGEARSLFGHAVSRRKQGRLDTEALLDRAARLFEEGGSRGGVLQTRNERGVVALAAGRAEDARRAFVDGLALALLPHEHASLEANLGLALAALGRDDEAKTHLELARRTADAQGAHGIASAVRVDLAALAARRRDWDAATEALGEACARLEGGRYVHPTLAAQAERVAAAAAEARPALARAALALAITQYARLEDAAGEARARAALDALG